MAQPIKPDVESLAHQFIIEVRTSSNRVKLGKHTRDWCNIAYGWVLGKGYSQDTAQEVSNLLIQNSDI